MTGDDFGLFMVCFWKEVFEDVRHDCVKSIPMAHCRHPGITSYIYETIADLRRPIEEVWGIIFPTTWIEYSVGENFTSSSSSSEGINWRSIGGRKLDFWNFIMDIQGYELEITPFSKEHDEENESVFLENLKDAFKGMIVKVLLHFGCVEISFISFSQVTIQLFRHESH